MIRFLPDSLTEAILRPIAMAVPDGGVYVEILAPDFRFAFALLLALAWLLFARGAARRLSPAVVLLLLVTLAFVPWLQTSGNGRYFIPFLIVVGPLCAGLVQLLPFTRGLRVAIAGLMVASQLFLLHEVNPWRTWGMLTWADGPAFPVDVPADLASQPATYVTLSSISYSLIAPRFDARSRWINISSLRGASDPSPDEARALRLIASPGLLRVVFPTVPGGQQGEAMDGDLRAAIDSLLAAQKLSIENKDACRLLRSSGMAAVTARRLDAIPREDMVHGFWVCPLARHAAVGAQQRMKVSAQTERVFERMEGICPRIFPPRDTVSMRLPSGAVRAYPSSDFKLYVLDNGEVWYKYVRALNPVLVGRTGDILAPSFAMDCNHIQGRSGLPWERGI